MTHITHTVSLNGVDAKILQYDIKTIPEQIIKKYKLVLNNSFGEDQKCINLNKLMCKLFNKEVSENLIMINIEKDKMRYNDTLEELKKFNVSRFHHLKATYWKTRDQFIEDLNYVVNFLSEFCGNYEKKKLNMNLFSEINDTNIHIQDGPLACWVSHLRAMIYGYTYFDDYTIIIEDDIDIRNTAIIEEYILQVPNDWDIIFFNCSPKNISYGDAKLYKLTNEFHSTHFYIIKNSSFPKIFSKLYPITDQVDVLLSNYFMEFNYYNLPGSVFQKNLSTNTQNNLYVIYNSLHYSCVRTDICQMKDQLSKYINRVLHDNVTINDKLLLVFLFDVIYSHIGHIDKENNETKYEKMKVNDHKLFIDSDNDLLLLVDAMVHFLYCTEKGTDVVQHTYGNISNIIDTLNYFDLHKKTINVNNILVTLNGYSYGSSSFVYISDDNKIIVKKYGNFLRWKTTDHDNIDLIYSKELKYLKLLNGFEYFPKLIDYSEKDKLLVLEYCGESLFDHFYLPENWKVQIKEIFECLNKNDVIYTEFNLKNILVKDDQIKFIDFGLAKCGSIEQNNINCEIFIELLDLLNNNLTNQKNTEEHMLMCKVFIDNIKLIGNERFLSVVY